jgi:FtsZ-interacting cell division protein ZipA
MQMDLRIIILTIGLVIIASILLDGWRRHRKTNRIKQFDETCLTTNQHQPSTQRFFTEAEGPDPLLMDEHDMVALEDPTQSVTSAKTKDNVNIEEIIAFRLFPKNMPHFSSEKCVSLLQKFGLQYDSRFKIYHGFLDEKKQTMAFSVASAYEPGTLPGTATPGETVPGLVFFMSVPSDEQAPQAFDGMILTARRMTASLEGELLDPQNQAVTLSIVAQYRERVIEGMKRFFAEKKLQAKR